MKEPVDHILRPQLPWRTDGGITECGYNAEKVSTLTRAAYFDRLKNLGQQRTAIDGRTTDFTRSADDAREAELTGHNGAFLVPRNPILITTSGFSCIARLTPYS